MPDARDKEALLRQNLKDAGCGRALTEDCLRCWREGTLKDKLPELCAHRETVLRQTREKQKQIDCLDYLTRKIKTEEFENDESRHNGS